MIPRYFPHDTSTKRSIQSSHSHHAQVRRVTGTNNLDLDAHTHLVESLTHLIALHPPSSPPKKGGLYNGTIGIAYLFYVLSPLYPNLQLVIDNQETTLYDIFQSYFTPLQAHLESDSFHPPRVGKCGIANDVFAILALGAASEGNEAMARRLVEFVRVVGNGVSGDEWLYGRAGYLYLLRLARTGFLVNEGGTGGEDQERKRKMRKMLDETMRNVVEAIFRSGRPWTWHDKIYVGAVHGIIGIITQIVLSDPERYAKKVEADLREVISCQFESGNWPSSLPPNSDRLVQVCHGAPGVVLCLISIGEYFPGLKGEIERAVERGRTCIRERGLLTKEPCLCHGISGNALALEGDQCKEFMGYTTGDEIENMVQERQMESSNSPGSLWCGLAGRAWAWAVVDKNTPKRLLGFNDL